MTIADTFCNFDIKRTIMIVATSVIHRPLSGTIAVSATFAKER